MHNEVQKISQYIMTICYNCIKQNAKMFVYSCLLSFEWYSINQLKIGLEITFLNKEIEGKYFLSNLNTLNLLMLSYCYC